MKMKQHSHTISGAFVFLLLGVFAVFSTLMVVLGVRAYRGGVERAAEHNAARIPSSYLRSMVRADDEAGVIRVEEEEGGSAIILENVYGADRYVTRLYVWGGFLREWFAAGDMPFEPESGEIVCEAEALEASLGGGLLSARLLCGGEWTGVDIALRAAGGEE